MTQATSARQLRLQQQAARSRQRRARLASGGVVCLLGVVAFMAITMWQRNREAVARMEADLKRNFVVPLKAEILRLEGHLPLEFPGDTRVRDAGRVSAYRYPAADSVVALRRRQEGIILGHSPRVTSFFGRNGYFVVLFDRAAFLECRGGAGPVGLPGPAPPGGVDGGADVLRADRGSAPMAGRAGPEALTRHFQPGRGGCRVGWASLECQVFDLFRT